MNRFALLGGVLGLLLFIPLCRDILDKEKGVEQNPLTFFLWAILDAVAARAIYLANGNYLQALLYCVGGLAVVACALAAGNRLRWTWFETFVTFLVLLCIVIWTRTNDTTAALASIIALFIASIPQMEDTWTEPSKTPTLIYFGYTAANFLAALGGKELSIVEVGYPVSALLVCATIFSLSLRKEA
ncbi:MAG: hypothetical protein ACYC48_02270 [Minisyncoccota bacterium]